jgi:predicted transcriptional regulator
MTLATALLLAAACSAVSAYLGWRDGARLGRKAGRLDGADEVRREWTAHTLTAAAQTRARRSAASTLGHERRRAARVGMDANKEVDRDE